MRPAVKNQGCLRSALERVCVWDALTLFVLCRIRCDRPIFERRERRQPSLKSDSRKLPE
jgi:hypothetical protein